MGRFPDRISTSHSWRNRSGGRTDYAREDRNEWATPIAATSDRTCRTDGWRVSLGHFNGTFCVVIRNSLCPETFLRFPVSHPPSAHA